MKKGNNIRQENISNVLKKIVEDKKTLEKHVRAGKPVSMLKNKGFKFVTPV